MEKARLSFVAWGLLAAHCQALSNTNYFTFPSKADEIPLVHTGDTLNVTWLSDYSQAVMYFWCDGGADLMQTTRDLGGDGSLSVVVNGSWTSPCHWQFCQQANEAIFVDSGHVQVTNERATPAVTWVPTTLGTACGLQQTTVTNSAGKTITLSNAASATATDASATSAAAGGGASSTSTSTACADAGSSPKLSSGASIGVGIAVGLAIAGVTTAIWLPLRRRYLVKRPAGYMHGPADMALQTHMQPKLVEADNQGTAEADPDARRTWTLPELPSTPHKRSP